MVKFKKYNKNIKLRKTVPEKFRTNGEIHITNSFQIWESNKDVINIHSSMTSFLVHFFSVFVKRKNIPINVEIKLEH